MIDAYFLPTLVMAINSSPVIGERHVIHHDDDSSSGMIAVLLIAAVLIIGFLLFAMRAFPFEAAGTPDNTTRMDINLPDVNVPATTPDVNVNNNVPPTGE